MANWRLAKSLETLRAQISQAYPNRSKASDGTIGDAAHSARTSDHNPNSKGVVQAWDMTHDPAKGLGGRALADALLASKDTRIKYIISDGQIASGFGANHPYGVWRKYTGSNPHNKHVHISVRDAESLYDDDRPWAIVLPKVAPAEAKKKGLQAGDKGQYVKELQGYLNTLGYGPLKADGDFGKATKAAVESFQRKNPPLQVDGIAGPRTVIAIGDALKAKKVAPIIKEAEKVVPPAAAKEVKEKTSLWTKIVGVFGGGGLGLGFLSGMDWQAVLAGGAVLVVLIVVLLLLQNRIIAAFKRINEEVHT